MSRYERLCAELGGSPAHLLRTMEGVLTRSGPGVVHANISLEFLMQLRIAVEELEREAEEPSAVVSTCACCCHVCTCTCHECEKCDCGVKCGSGDIVERPRDERRTRTELLLMQQCDALEKLCKDLQQELQALHINR
jgi:hypothetical protein